MSATPAKNYTRIALAIVIAAIVIAAAIVTTSTGSTTVTKTIPGITTSTETTTTTVISTSITTPITTSSSQQTGVTTSCTIVGQPGPFYVRVVSDSSQIPIAGAQVTAINEPAYCNGSPATNQAALTFTTNSTEWYSLNSQNNGGYSFAVKFSGQTYNFAADTRPVSVTCASLYIPSGRTNVTISEFQSSCPTTTTATATSGSQLYNVTFQQVGACSPPVYTVPWSVTLGNKTEAKPPNTPIPIANGSYTAGPEPAALYTIVFTSIPSGVYQYKIAPSGPFFVTSGTVTVNGGDVSVPVEGPAVSCETSTSME